MPRIGSQTELEALAWAADYLELHTIPKEAKHLRSLLAKLTKKTVATPGAPAAQIEQTLVAFSGGRVVPVQGGPGFWAMQSKKYATVNANVEDALILAAWLAEQGWLKVTYTIDSLFYKWPSYLAQAKAASGKKKETWNDREDWPGDAS